MEFYQQFVLRQESLIDKNSEGSEKTVPSDSLSLFFAHIEAHDMCSGWAQFGQYLPEIEKFDFEIGSSDIKQIVHF